jgi:hypothetical protein
MPTEVEFRRLRADELRARASADAVAIVPFGAIEQHGPHLPVEVDSLLGHDVALRTARKMAARAEPVVVLPMVWTGVSEHHMSFGGTITLDLATYAALAEGICRSLVRHGFRRLVLLNGHGGNDNALRCIADDLTPKLGVPIIQFTYWHPTGRARENPGGQPGDGICPARPLSLARARRRVIQRRDRQPGSGDAGKRRAVAGRHLHQTVRHPVQQGSLGGTLPGITSAIRAQLYLDSAPVRGKVWRRPHEAGRAPCRRHAISCLGAGNDIC